MEGWNRSVSSLYALAVLLLVVLMLGGTLFRVVSPVYDLTRLENDGLLVEYAHRVNHEGFNLAEMRHQSMHVGALNSAVVVIGQTDHWYRLRLENQNAVSVPYHLVLDNPTLDRILVYQTDEFQTVQKTWRFGDEQHDIELFARVLPNVGFSLPAHSTAFFWVRVQTTGAPLLPLLILQETDFEQYQRLLHVLWGVCIGTVLLMATYNLVLYLGVRDSSYLHYISYILSVLVLLGVVHGFGFYFLPIEVQSFFSRSAIVVNCVVGFFALRFAMSFLHIGRTVRYSYRIGIALQWLTILYGLAALFMVEYVAAKGFSAIQLLIYCGVATMVGYKFRDRISWTRYYLISWVPFFIGAAVAFLLFVGLLPYNFLTRHALMIAVLAEMALIALALADRMGASERERLFITSHDRNTGFANESLIDHRISELCRQNKADLILLALRITNHNLVFPYLPQQQLTKLLTTLGHNLTDQLQKHFQLESFTAQHAHPNDHIAMVGNSVLLCLVRSEDNDAFRELLERLSNRENFNPMPDQVQYRIHCNFAYVDVREFSETPENILKGVQQALHMARLQRVPYLKYQPEFSVDSMRKVQLAQDLERALAANELQLYHQPQLCFSEPESRCSEVLVRWTHPDLGFISPVEFVAIAEEVGLIKRLSLWVIRTSLEQIQQLREQSDVPVKVSINISANDVSRPNFHTEVAEILKDFPGVMTSAITLEVTETSHYLDPKIFQENLLALHKAGFRLAIDDFGTGYSSLTYVSDHPFDELKVDRTFVYGMLMSERQHQIVDTTIDMAIKLGLSVTAEGVEDIETLTALRALGCSKAQGYYYAKPMSFADYLDWQHTFSETEKG